MMKRLSIVVACVLGTSIFGMVFDNRYMPLFQKPFTRYCEQPHRLIVQPFTMLARHSWIDVSTEVNSKEEGPLFSSIYGYFNQVTLDKALQEAGITTGSLFRSDMQGLGTLPWCQRGRFDGYGIAVQYDQSLTRHFGYGFSMMFMQVNSRMNMMLMNASAFPAGDVQELYALRQRMMQLQGLTSGIYSKLDFGDIDFYLRFGALKEYCLKFRKIDIGLRVGVLVPTAKPRCVDNPASIYIGGDGHWGLYTMFDTEIELKDCLKVGLWARLSGRFSKTLCERIPLAGEPLNFGALKAPVTIKPGLTGVFMPYFALEGLRDGFGVKVIYTLVQHASDCWNVCTKKKIDYESIRQYTKWGSEYLTVDLMYDFALDKECRRFAPCVQLAIDIPLNFVLAHRSFKTYGVSCLIQADF